MWIKLQRNTSVHWSFHNCVTGQFSSHGSSFEPSRGLKKLLCVLLLLLSGLNELFNLKRSRWWKWTMWCSLRPPALNKKSTDRQTESSRHEHNPDEAKLCIIGHETDFVWLLTQPLNSLFLVCQRKNLPILLHLHVCLWPWIILNSSYWL